MIGKLIPFLLVMILFPALCAAQIRDAQVLRRGEIRLTGGGEHVGFDREYDGSGTRLLTAGLGGTLDPATFSPLAILSSEIESFLAATDTTVFPITGDDLLAGDLLVDIAWNTRSAPIRLSVGIFPRVEVSIGTTPYRTERLPTRFGVSGGRLGLNPDGSGNSALLGALDPSGTALGSGSLLPIEGSALGNELQRRVLAAGGDSLDLPDVPLTGGEFRAAFGVDPFPHVISVWRPGDLDLTAKVQVLTTLRDTHYPVDPQGLNYRLSVEGGIRLPTGERGFENPRLDWGPDVGHGAVHGAAALDLMIGRRLWATAGIGVVAPRAADVRFATSSETIPGDETVIVEATRTPGAELDFWLMPRLRLSDEMSLGANLRAQRWGEGSIEVGAADVEIPTRSRNTAGITLQFTNLPAYDAGRSGVPIEATLGVNASVSGSGGAPVARSAFLQLSLLRQLWGRRSREP